MAGLDRNVMEPEDRGIVLASRPTARSPTTRSNVHEADCPSGPSNKQKSCEHHMCRDNVSTSAADRAAEEKASLLTSIAERYGLKQQQEEIAHRMRDARLGLLALVMGEGNFGKSSLLNALAGQPIAPVSALPKTFKVDIYAQGGPDETRPVFMRTADRPAGFDLSVEEANARCAEDEERVIRARREKTHYRPAVLETIRRVPSFKLGPDICLVDTPGLSQSLLGDEAKQLSLVSGLENTYVEIEQVWAKWYARADIVLWCIPADKLQSKETEQNLRTLVGRYRKEIVPVITKADLVGDRRDQSVAEFKRLYAPLLGDPKLFVTACNEKQPFVGVDELRGYLLSLAPDARERKQIATRTSLEDAASHIDSALCQAATNAVSNLRAIASAADEVALKAISDCRIALGGIRKVGIRYRSHVAGLRRVLLSIDQQLRTEWSAMKSWYDLWPSDEQKARLRKSAEDRVKNYLDTHAYIAEINGHVMTVGAGLSELADGIVRKPEFRLKQITLDSGGAQWEETFEMKMIIPTIAPPPTSAHSPSLGLMIPNALTLLKEMLLEVFGKSPQRDSLTEDEQQFIAKVNSSMAEHVVNCLERCRSHVTKKIAEPIVAAVGNAYEVASRSTVASVLETLATLDADLILLTSFSSASPTSRAKYMLQARYWTSTTFDEALFRQVAADHLRPLLPQIVTRASTFTITAERLGGHRWRHEWTSELGLARMPDSDGHREDKTQPAPWLGPATFVGRFSVSSVLNDRATLQDGAPSLADILQGEFRTWMAESDTIRELEPALDKQFPGSFQDVGITPAVLNVIDRLYRAHLVVPTSLKEPLVCEASVPVMAVIGLPLSPRTIPVAACTALAVAAPLLVTDLALGWQITGPTMAFATMVVLGYIQARRQLGQVISLAARAAACHVARLAGEQTSRQIDVSTCEAAMEAVAKRLSPRPLQQAIHGLIDPDDKARTP
jgi:hypothetical protein